MIITREKGMRMWGGGSGNTSVSGASSGGGFSLTVAEGEGTGNAYTDFTYESGTLTLNKATEFVTVDFFNKLFTAYDANGNVIVPNNTTPTLDNIKFKAGAWTEQYLSALGQNSSGGGGGGGIELSDVWQSLKTNTDDYANQKINSAHIPDLSGTYATKTWVNQQGFVTSSGVTSVAMTVPTGLSVSGTPITTTGTLALTFATGYSIPTTAKQSNWDTAYGWGNHATAGYASASSVTTLQGYFTNGVAKTAAKLNTGTTTYTAWGQTYWSSGVPQSISGNMTSVGSITPSANGNALGTTSARFNIYGTAGNFSGNVSITGTLGVTGATTLSSSLSVASGITLTTTKKIYFGDTSHYIELTSTGFHFSHGVYSDSFVSALGANSSGGGGGGTFDEEAMWTALGTTITAKVIASSHIPNLNASKITSGTLADARIPSLAASKITSGTFDTARIPNLSADKITSGTFAAARIPDLSGRYYALYGGTPLTGTSSSHYDLNNLLTVGSYYCAGGATAAYIDNKPTNTNSAFRVWVSATTGTASGHYLRQRFQFFSQVAIYERTAINDSDVTSSDWGNWYLVQASLANYALTSSLNNYLPLSGGALTGGLEVGGTLYTKGFAHMIKFDVDTSRALGYGWWDTNSNTVASIVYHNTAQNIILNPIGSSAIYTDAVGKYSLFIGNNKLTYNTYTILHSNNTYVSSGKGYINGTEITTISGNAASASYLSYSHTNEINFKGGMQVNCYFNFRNADSDSQDGGTTAINYKFCNYTRETAYSTVTAGTFVGAFSGNATTATTLATSRTIWGQSFNGSANVSGAMTGVADITLNDGARISKGAASGSILYIGDSNNSGWVCLQDMCSQTGTGDTYWSIRNGGNAIFKECTATSDERKKNILGDTTFSVKDIADTRSILFEWKDNTGLEKKVHGGSIAQDWLGKADWALTLGDDGYYSLNYGALALCSAITIAREVVKHEDRITLLEKENAKLKARVAELEERRVA